MVCVRIKYAMSHFFKKNAQYKMLPCQPLRTPADCSLQMGTLLNESREVPLLKPVEPDQHDACAKLSRKPREMGLYDWIAEVLVSQRGVLAALPRGAWPADASEVGQTLSRVVSLDPTKAASKSWWWAWRLRASKYQSTRPSDELTSVHTADGLDDQCNSWFPTTQSYDALVSEDAFEKLTLAGFSTHIRACNTEKPFHQHTDLKQRLLLELEAAATGLAPAVLSVFLVHSNDNYQIHKATRVASTHDVSDLPKIPGRDTNAVSGMVSVTQATLFTLSDILHSYRRSHNSPLLRPSLPSVSGNLHELSSAIARRVRALADSKILKLNITAETVVFVPNLCECENGDLQSTGYGYLDMTTVRGVPMMTDFDPKFTKRFTASATDYDPDCAYTVMMLVFLASIRAQHGPSVQQIFVNKLIGRTPDGKPVHQNELPDDFDHIDLIASSKRARARGRDFGAAMRSITPAGASNREAAGRMVAEAAEDFVRVVESGTLQQNLYATRDSTSDNTPPFDKTRPLFRLLVNYLLRTTDSDTSVFSTATTDTSADDEKTQSTEDRLMQLVLLRSASRS